MSALLVTLSRVNNAVYSPLDLPYTSLPVMSLPADSVSTMTALLPYIRSLCFAIAALVFLLRRAPKSPSGFHLLFIHRTREHHMNTATYDAHMHSSPSCPVCGKSFEAESTVAVLHCQHCFHPNCLSGWLDDRHDCPTCGDAVPEQLVWPIDSWAYAVPYWLRAVMCAHHQWLDVLFVAVSAVLLVLELALCVVGEGSVTALLLAGLTLRHSYNLHCQ